jgi:hypothetical protein
VADLDCTGGCAPGLGHISSTRTGDGHDARVARFAMVRRDGSRTRQGRTIGVDARRPLEDDMTTRHPPHMEPPILWPCEPKAQEVVVGVCAPDQHLPPVRQGMRDDASAMIVW